MFGLKFGLLSGALSKSITLDDISFSFLLWVIFFHYNSLKREREKRNDSSRVESSCHVGWGSGHLSLFIIKHELHPVQILFSAPCSFTFFRLLLGTLLMRMMFECDKELMRCLFSSLQWAN